MRIAELITESKAKSKAPQGVIFKGDDTVFVGQAHGKPVRMDQDLKERVMKIIQKHGAYYEGIGSDREFTKDYTTQWHSKSWDDMAIESIKGYPYEFLFVLFTNTAANEQKKILVGNGTIAERILKTQSQWGYIKSRRFDADTLDQFLRACNEDGHDFVAMSREPATVKNVKKFIDTGEKLMWPEDWMSYPNRAGKLAKKANDYRNNYVLKRKSGAYFMGSGHLKEIAELGDLDIVGGESIS